MYNLRNDCFDGAYGEYPLLDLFGEFCAEAQ